ncbi:MAG: hypothetical protein JJV98_21895 [Desulfosarcina sp.]|nr:hypothetical protein [Desulfobacterales bacterium]
MNTVTLKTNGALFTDGQPVDAEPLRCLGFKLLLEAGVTVRSLFAMLERYPLLIRLNAFFPTYLEQYRSAPANGCQCDDFSHIEFNKTVEMVGYPGEPRLDIYSSLTGAGSLEPREMRNYELEQLLDMPLKLGRLKHIVFGDKVDQFEFETVFNLFEFIDGVVWELSFHGALRACALRR